MAERIDVIIPAYNAQKTLFRALASVAMQTVANRITVTVVDDGSRGGSYADALKRFKGVLDVRMIRQENAGPGAARQKGIDASKGDIVMFLDADDMFNGPFAIEELLKDLGPDKVAVFGQFIEQQGTEDSLFVLHKNTEMIWMFAAAYRRAFLDKHGVRMVTSRLSEDTSFNVLVKLYGGYDVAFSEYPAVCWMWTPGSITRGDVENYNYGEGFEGYIDSIRLAFEYADTRGGFDRALGDELRCFYMGRFYGGVLRSAQLYPGGEAANMRAVARFYRAVIMPAIERLTPAMLQRQFGIACGEINKVFIPGVTYGDWIKQVAEVARGIE